MSRNSSRSAFLTAVFVLLVLHFHRQPRGQTGHQDKDPDTTSSVREADSAHELVEEEEDLEEIRGGPLDMGLRESFVMNQRGQNARRSRGVQYLP